MTTLLNKYLVLLSVAFVLFSCDRFRIYEKNNEIIGNAWKSSDIMTYNVDITDTGKPYNLYINIRNSGMYSYSNLYLFIKTRFPDSTYFLDTVECVLADETGKWLGKGTGNVIFNRIPYKMNFRFPQKGNYAFYIEQGMRVTELSDIMDVGLRIEEVD